MSKLEEKIKALLSDESIENMVPPVDDDEGFNDSCRDVSIGLAQQWRDEIAKLYAEQYSVTWEQLGEHCKENYPGRCIIYDDEIHCALAVITKKGEIIHRKGLKRETLVIFGRYLEGLSDE